MDAVLADLYELELQHGGVPHGHTTAAVEAMSFGMGGVGRSLQELESRGLAQRASDGRWRLTSTGTAEAGHLAKMHGGDIGSGDADRRRLAEGRAS